MANTLHTLQNQAHQPVTSGRSTLLRTVLRENAVFSIASGALLVIGAGRLDTWLGVNTWLLVGFGVALVLYGETIWFGARRDNTLVVTGRAAVVGDLTWVLVSVELIAATSWLTRSGEIALALITIPVALFAALQLLGLERVRT